MRCPDTHPNSYEGNLRCVLDEGHSVAHESTEGLRWLAEQATPRCAETVPLHDNKCLRAAGHDGNHDDGNGWTWSTDGTPVPDRRTGPDDRRHYDSLRSVLDRAYEQASDGKGKERHSSGEPFTEQPIVVLGKWMQGTIAFNVGQACKKSIEATRLPKAKAMAELLGAINYLAGAVLILEASDA